MDEYTGKRAAGKLGFSRRGSSLAFRDPNHEDRNVQYCSRLGCSSRLNTMKNNQVSDQEKLKYSKASFRSISSKAIAGSSSISFSSSSDFRKSRQERQKQISLQESAIAESSSRQGGFEDLRHYNSQELIDSESSSREGETDDSEFSSITSGTQTVLPNSEEFESAILQGFPTNATEALGNSSAASTSMLHKQVSRRLGSGKQYTPGSSVRRSLASRNTAEAAKSFPKGTGAGAQRYGLKSLGCTSISDVLPLGCSSSDFGHNRRVDAVRKRPSEGENSSSAGGKSMSRFPNGGSSHSGLSGSLPVRSMPQQISRKGRNQPTNRDGAVSVRTRRGLLGETRTRLHEREGDNVVLPSETNVIPQLAETQFSVPEDVPESSSRAFLAERPPVSRSTYGRRSGTSGQTARNRTSSRLEDSSTQIFRGPSGDRDGFRRYNMEGIAEVLLALERIEQDEELTYEQLLVIETNLFLGGLSFHDQHRDMRMDIDNMSYEELLALEEKMGNVSTALTEEALSKCLKRSIYTRPSGFPGRGGDDIKCSICQEEYAIGDEVGKLACEHRYHVTCIHHWLSQKNWCPICKAPTCPS